MVRIQSLKQTTHFAMLLRSSRIIAPPAEASAFRETYTDTTKTVRAHPGNLAVRLWEHRTSPGAFFVNSWWSSMDDVHSAAELPAVKAFHDRSAEFLMERRKSWHLELIERAGATQQLNMKTPPVMRLSKAVIKSAEIERMLEMYTIATQTFTLKQPGCILVRLFRDLQHRNVFFIQSLWESADALEANLSSAGFQKLRLQVLDVMEERLHTWNLHLLDDDPRRPLCLPEDAVV